MGVLIWILLSIIFFKFKELNFQNVLQKLTVRMSENIFQHKFVSFYPLHCFHSFTSFLDIYASPWELMNYGFQQMKKSISRMCVCCWIFSPFLSFKTYKGIHFSYAKQSKIRIFHFSAFIHHSFISAFLCSIVHIRIIHTQKYTKK